MNGRTLLILGCGYLGMRLVESARSAGAEVRAVSRNADRLADAARLGAKVFRGMVDEDGWHDFAGTEVDLVVNCVSSAGGGLAGYRQSYIEGNRSLGRWMDKTGFSGKSVYTSSVSVYADAEGATVDETNVEEPGNERGRLIRESEQAFLKLTGGSGYVLRLGGLYGPGRHLMLDTLRAEPSELPGWSDYHLNLVRIEDVVSAVWACLLEEGAGGVYNVVDDVSALKSEIVRWLSERLGVAEPVFTGAAPAEGRSSRRFGEGGRPADRVVLNGKLKAATGWGPNFPSYREGFGDLIAGLA